LPSTGRITYLRAPSGPGVRWDAGIETGSDVGLFYDPMLAKLIVYAPTREAAVERMRRALGELVIDGLETSRDFHLRVFADDEFRRGAIDIHWLERRLPSLIGAPAPAETVELAAVAAALLAHEDKGRPIANGQAAPPADAPVSAWTRLARQEGLR